MMGQPVARACMIAATALSGAVMLVASQPSPASASSDRECLARAMYFESVKNADDGMLAVGTVVANRLKSGRYGGSICGVVGQQGQFAPGVMSRSMTGEAAERARRVAEAVLNGKRHPSVREAMFFHTAGLRFRYPNMHYVTVAGGNIFYEKRSANSAVAMRENAASMARAYALAKVHQSQAAPVLASAARPGGSLAGQLFAFAAPTAAPVSVLTQINPPAVARTTAVAPLPPARPTTSAAPAVTVLASIGPARSVAAPLPPSRPRIAGGEGYALASAYAAPATRSGDALAVVAAMETKAKPRVIAMTAPVQATMVPVPAARPPVIVEAAAAPSPRANMVVAMAWSAFD